MFSGIGFDFRWEVASSTPSPPSLSSRLRTELAIACPRRSVSWPSDATNGERKIRGGVWGRRRIESLSPLAFPFAGLLPWVPEVFLARFPAPVMFLL